MAYTGNPSTNPVDEIRLRLGDIDPDFPLMGDEEYQYFLGKNPVDLTSALLGAAQSLLFYISRYTRERTGMIEVYGAEAFNNYLAAYKLLLKNPLGALNLAPIPYFGGISRSELAASRVDSDSLNPAFYRGETSLRPIDLDRRPQIDRGDIDAINNLGNGQEYYTI